ncbi:bacteriohemerythrin [Sedimenticola hydrogenitrophicus]|uniref:bacteriohemerythrin n=1 Tax=Sedimenticola hydrogenitrophicus TaxID=2967975 RepID=UPI0023B00308|nr:hemerythrin domain-containing protein [Sedimenticola hydrogenitrophicus]
MQPMIDADNPSYRLGVTTMDQTHHEFIALVNQLAVSERDDFVTLFAQLVKHTHAHFNSEAALMEQYRFSAIREHTDEHQRVLGELDRFGEKVARGSIAMGQDYVQNHLPGWFDLHARTMDSALAAHLKLNGNG